MKQIAEQLAAERIVAHILDNAAAVCVCVRLDQLVRGRIWESFQQQRLDILIPSAIDNRLMGQNRICVERRSYRKNEEARKKTAHGKDAAGLGPNSSPKRTGSYIKQPQQRGPIDPYAIFDENVI